MPLRARFQGGIPAEKDMLRDNGCLGKFLNMFRVFSTGVFVVCCLKNLCSFFAVQIPSDIKS